MKYQNTGFTLMELMITIVIIGVIAAIAFPSYQDSVRKSRRTEAKTALLDVMARQEQYFSENRVYASRFDELSLGSYGAGMSTENGYYRMNISINSATNTVSVIAVADDSQVDDSVSSYSISSNGRKTSVVSGSQINGWE